MGDAGGEFSRPASFFGLELSAGAAGLASETGLVSGEDWFSGADLTSVPADLFSVSEPFEVLDLLSLAATLVWWRGAGGGGGVGTFAESIGFGSSRSLRNRVPGEAGRGTLKEGPV